MSDTEWCGTRRGYGVHRRRKEQACGPCIEANRVYNQEFTRRHGRPANRPTFELPPFDDRKDLACRAPGVDPEWWYAESTDPRLGKAIEACHRCPVTVECRNFAIEHRIQHGVYGGLTSHQRGYTRRDGAAA